MENRHLEQNQFIKSSSDQSAHFTFKENAGRYSERCTTIAGVLILNPLNPNISMQILHTVPYTCPKVLTRRMFLISNRFFSC